MLNKKVFNFCMQSRILNRLKENMKIDDIKIKNISKMHNKGDETHFNISIISDDFKDLSAVKRHQKVYKILEKEL
jgi:BolA protein